MAWRQLVQNLRNAGVTMVSPQEVAFMQEKGVVVIDIRPAAEYATGFISGSTNVPLFQPIEGWDAFKIVRRMSFAAFGVLNATEPNPSFLQDLAELAEKDAGVILVCNLGGVIDRLPGQSSVGVQSRSLIAAHELTKAGYSNVRVLKGGINGWKQDGRDVFVMQDVESDAEA